MTDLAGDELKMQLQITCSHPIERGWPRAGAAFAFGRVVQQRVTIATMCMSNLLSCGLLLNTPLVVFRLDIGQWTF